MQILDYETVVVGGGLAGLTSAYHASVYGKVALITKSTFDVSNSYFAQGGIAAAISDDDSPELHMNDTLKAGRGICNEDAVHILVNEGRDSVLELIEMGMQFDSINGKLVAGLEGAHSKRRILHAGGDATGRKLTNFMQSRVMEQKRVFAYEYIAGIKLLVADGQIRGIHAIDLKTGENLIFRTKAVILATGGFSRLYSRTTNPETATGDGIAMAWEAGAQISDIEFIQFHPSALCIPGEDAFLISEAVRGEGARLLNKNGHRFMKDAHPLAELAPRDVVSYNIYRQIQETGSNCVYLSLKHLDPEKINSRFKNISLNLKFHGLDLAKDLIPVSPAAHYTLGGIKTDLNAETNIMGLFACGEAASTGVSGANRLASNSLLECLVFGKRAALNSAKISRSDSELPEVRPVSFEAGNSHVSNEDKNIIAGQLMNNLGIVRNSEGLLEAAGKFSKLEEKYSTVDSDYDLIKVKNRITVCNLIAKAALLRNESRGGHIRTDFPEEETEFELHIVQQKNREIKFEPVIRNKNYGSKNT